MHAHTTHAHARAEIRGIAGPKTKLEWKVQRSWANVQGSRSRVQGPGCRASRAAHLEQRPRQRVKGGVRLHLLRAAPRPQSPPCLWLD